MKKALEESHNANLLAAGRISFENIGVLLMSSQKTAQRSNIIFVICPENRILTFAIAQHVHLNTPEESVCDIRFFTFPHK
jgi:hypothetical protein